MIDAGQMDYSVAFDAPSKIPDGHGGTENGWTADNVAVKEYAAFRFLRGGETVQAARLQGKQPVVVTVYSNSVTRQITTAWRMRDVRAGAYDAKGNWRGDVYNIRSIVPTNDRQFLEITAEKGVAL
ncbi:head-tail adaptor [Pseudochrobactrum saccharolyticum]|uniref:Head-tail adaptor n=1 Tax=Pseudochrobactrum saccharolyticum TaxID=354352 RepID=A0A7W8AJY1_9HYPH|nr:head-tail adaptor protein [Pseudochrobactrum saccharolyticum]KAB0538473.1 head-tail adaptor protein [Pseudochrobactrum saccharolyticum]MBB5091758.1 head-tail adaptor [Pseudochrobactrum saccharolyticum]